MSKHDDLLDQGPREAPEPELSQASATTRGALRGAFAVATGTSS